MTEPLQQPAPSTNAAEFSVSELASAIKRALEDGFGYVRLRGEISGYRGPHSSGHCYFALKDDRAKIEAVIWRGNFQRLRFRPEEGLEVIAQGRITTFPGSSKYQIVVETLEPAGVGALMALLEERKRKFAAEGLFDEARKKPVPFLPRVVGIVTSPTGAVIRDMLHGFAERFPVHVVVWPVRVQGDTCAGEVAAAIRGFNALAAGGKVPRPDVIIVARGGGSLEDLWGFNEEAVVRAASESAIPLIAAIGHETDWTLIDLVADARAPTPTKAAEWAVPRHADLSEQTGKLDQRLGTAVRRVLSSVRTHLKAAARGLPRLEDLLALPRQRFDAVEKRLGRALLANTRSHAMHHARLAARLHPRLLSVRLARTRDRLESLERQTREALARVAGGRRVRLTRVGGRLNPQTVLSRLSRAADRLTTLGARAEQAITNRMIGQRRALESQGQVLASLSHYSVLRRGFAIVRDAQGHAVRSVAKAPAGRRLDVELADGRFAALSEGPAEAGQRTDPASQSTPQDARAWPSPSPKRRRDGGGEGQGSLL